MLDDMIEESQPYVHRPEDVTVVESATFTPVQLCNLAWQKFETASPTYRSWERTAIESFLKSN